MVAPLLRFDAVQLRPRMLPQLSLKLNSHPARHLG
jgi:hypothetical protein